MIKQFSAAALARTRSTCGLASLLLCAASLGVQASPATWQELRSAYDYDMKQALDVQIVKETPLPVPQGGKEILLRFRSANNETVPALLLLPGSEGKRYPCLLTLHGHGMTKESMRVLSLLVMKGYALMALDAAGHGERKPEGAQQQAPTGGGQAFDLKQTRQGLIQTVIDYRRAMDYLETRPEIDSKRIGLIGASMGAMTGAILAGVDERVKTSILLVGGGDWRRMLEKSNYPAIAEIRQRSQLKPEEVASLVEAVDPINFVEHISPRPLLMLNTKGDDVIPRECTEALFAKAKEPKFIEWYEGGHVPDTQTGLQMLVKAMEWLEGRM